MTSPRILRYPWESVIAEKFEAMIRLGEINSRMKDFYDIWLLSRQTPLPNQKFDIFGSEFAEHRQPLWSQFAVGTGVEGIPDSFAEILEDLSDFLLSLCIHLNENGDYGKRWQPGEGWQ